MTGSTHDTSLITAREWRRVLLFTLVILIGTSLPYWLGWATHQGDTAFSGFLIGVDDGNSYLGKMRLGAAGHLDFHLFYTTEPHESAPLLFLPYILPGYVIGRFIPATDPALTGVLIGVYHLLRLVFDALLILVLYRLIAVFLRPSRLRLLALILATLGGGLGWLLLFAGESPPEWFIPEGFGFLVLFTLPHLALARAALLGGLLLLFRGLGANRRWLPWSLAAGGCWLIVGLAVPFYLVVIYGILGAWGLAVWLRERHFPLILALRGGIAAALTLPLFAYNLIVFTSNPAFAQWSAQNLLPSPPPLHYLLAYLPLGVLAVVGGRWAWRRAAQDGRYALLVAWPLIVPLLVYLPVNVQRRMAEAVLVPLGILAAAGVGMLVRHKWRRGVVIVLLLTLASTLLLWGGMFLTALSTQPPVAFPQAEIAAFNWLNAHAQPGEAVLSAFSTGNRIPAYTNLRVYAGHGPETLDATAKTETIRRFFAGELSAADRTTLYDTAHIRTIIYGPAERALAGDTADTPAWIDDKVTLVYDSGGYQIFTVQSTP
ncbi:MAG: hypothetical protein H6672_03465 [Anaerolineaceae bacterium]|nr:hypothetical protein [Anaerolineaceae bacterium]